MGATMKRSGFFLVGLVFLSGISLILAAPASSADNASSGEKISKTGIPYVSDTPPAGAEELYS